MITRIIKAFLTVNAQQKLLRSKVYLVFVMECSEHNEIRDK